MEVFEKGMTIRVDEAYMRIPKVKLRFTGDGQCKEDILWPNIPSFDNPITLIEYSTYLQKGNNGRGHEFNFCLKDGTESKIKIHKNVMANGLFSESKVDSIIKL